MEAVFKTPELVDLILGYFRVIPSNNSLGPSERIHVSREDLQVTSDDEKRSALYRMALTNKAISHTALPILWFTIDGILPLLKLVSGLKNDNTVGRWVLTRTLFSRDFERLEFFSSMVKHIVLHGATQPLCELVHPSAVFDICMMRRDKPLVPGLKTLWIENTCEYGTLLLTETLKWVKIVDARDPESQDIPSPSAWNLLRLLPARAPFLEELYVGSPPSSSNLSDILKLEHLKKLTFDISDRHWLSIDVSARYHFFKGLERLARLRELDVGGMLEDYRSTIDPLLEPKAVCYRFPALETLKLTGFDDHLLKLLTQLPGNSLKELAFRLDDNETWDDLYEGEDDEGISKFRLDEAFSSLGGRNFLSLTKLAIDCDGPTFKGNHLRSLLQAAGMIHFDLQPACWELDDELILEMASAWPNLECFRLFTGYPPPPLAWPTLVSLQTFARLCPKLRRISIDVDPKVTAIPPGQPPHRLEHLTVFSVGRNANIVESNVPAVAEFLSATFPALMLAFCERWRQVGYIEGENWDAVFQVLLRDRNKDEVAALKNMFTY
ncbi:hypothetical protein EST38_g14554 [Candolleomyces aberdarensis]|uniref:F-box domain-containing protein n=1 Tax=Candolleomyces aberdarensis TaxID=2316362 RepID=A0A4Q2CZD0_9AGAR|nr:hypothetical protein EST38_g14554 [Candolleomyces aberdarensis]